MVRMFEVMDIRIQPNFDLERRIVDLKMQRTELVMASMKIERSIIDRAQTASRVTGTTPADKLKVALLERKMAYARQTLAGINVKVARINVKIDNIETALHEAIALEVSRKADEMLAAHLVRGKGFSFDESRERRFDGLLDQFINPSEDPRAPRGELILSSSMVKENYKSNGR